MHAAFDYGIRFALGTSNRLDFTEGNQDRERGDKAGNGNRGGVAKSEFLSNSFS